MSLSKRTQGLVYWSDLTNEEVDDHAIEKNKGAEAYGYIKKVSWQERGQAISSPTRGGMSQLFSSNAWNIVSFRLQEVEFLPSTTDQ